MKKILIVAGGYSKEREISIKTAKSVYKSRWQPPAVYTGTTSIIHRRYQIPPSSEVAAGSSVPLSTSLAAAASAAA